MVDVSISVAWFHVIYLLNLLHHFLHTNHPARGILTHAQRFSCGARRSTCADAADLPSWTVGRSFGVRVLTQSLIYAFQQGTERIRLFLGHFRVIQKMTARLDEQCPQRAQFAGRVTDHPMFILVDISTRRSGFRSFMLSTDETGFHFYIHSHPNQLPKSDF